MDKQRFLRTWPALGGGLLALLAATLFGVSTPLIQRLGTGLGPATVAALLYAGAALTGLLSRRPAGREARLSLSDLPRLGAMAAFGAALGPVALAWGLQHTSATSASLMLTLEAVFTAVLAWAFYGETMDRRVWTAMALLTAGAGLLVLDQGQSGQAPRWGLLAVLLATAAWAADNTVSRALAERDPGQVVMAKALLGSAVTGTVAFLRSEPLPGLAVALLLLTVGASGYGWSLRLYLLAQRAFGAGRTASVFSFAPFIGAAAAFAMGEHLASWLLLVAAALMVLGVVLHLAEDHDHLHTHEALEHEHAHRHDDGHHDHWHPIMPLGSHSHRHRHAQLTHAHPHVPDAHHRHTHETAEG
jgi:drug/metabolite transporter (DMT)-like permease